MRSGTCMHDRQWTDVERTHTMETRSTIDTGSIRLGVCTVCGERERESCEKRQAKDNKHVRRCVVCARRGHMGVMGDMAGPHGHAEVYSMQQVPRATCVPACRVCRVAVSSRGCVSPVGDSEPLGG